MKKFGRQAQYYNETNSLENLNNNNLYESQSLNNDVDYEDPVDLQFQNLFQQNSNSNFKSGIKSNNKKIKETYDTPKFKSAKSRDSFTYKTNNNNSSSYVRFIRLSELDDNNPYNRLEISQLANEEEIRKAYKKLIIANHPDKGGDSNEFNKIHEAYQMLSNPITKKIIDTFGSISLELVKNIIDHNLLTSKQLIEDINFCIQQNDYPQLYFLLYNIKT